MRRERPWWAEVIFIIVFAVGTFAFLNLLADYQECMETKNQERINQIGEVTR